MLDVDSILQEVIDSACALTGARYGALLTFDESGGLGNLITSGITPEERRRLGDPPKGLGLLGYLNEIEGSLRVSDISGHASSVGFPENHPPMRTFLGSPVRFQGERLGNIYLTEKEGGREFSQEDEEILAMFASQSAAVIANSRVLSTARQARADMEALVNVSPVGVLVFDARTGDLLSVNDESRRMVRKLNAPGRSLSRTLVSRVMRRHRRRPPASRVHQAGQLGSRPSQVPGHPHPGRVSTVTVSQVGGLGRLLDAGRDLVGTKAKDAAGSSRLVPYQRQRRHVRDGQERHGALAPGVGLGAADQETAGAVSLGFYIPPAQGGGFGDPQHGVPHQADQGDVQVAPGPSRLLVFVPASPSQPGFAGRCLDGGQRLGDWPRSAWTAVP